MVHIKAIGKLPLHVLERTLRPQTWTSRFVSITPPMKETFLSLPSQSASALGPLHSWFLVFQALVHRLPLREAPLTL